MLEKLTEKELLKTGDKESVFCILYNRYWELLYRKSLARLGNSYDAQDVVQEVFISFWRNIDTIRVEETIAPYFLTALKFCIIKKVYRRARQGMSSPLSVAELDRASVTTEELFQYKELLTLVNLEVNKLPERMQEIYRLSRVENLQIAEIAGHLNISEQTVKNTLTSALKRLRKSLAHYSYCFLLL